MSVTKLNIIYWIDVTKQIFGTVMYSGTVTVILTEDSMQSNILIQYLYKTNAESTQKATHISLLKLLNIPSASIYLYITATPNFL